MMVDGVLIVAGSFLLFKATDLMVGALNRLSRDAHVGKFGLTVFLVALSTSLPELFVGVTAAVEGKPELALGNVLGSNIANTSLVIGGAALIAGSVGVVGEFLKRDVFTAFLVGAVPLMLLLDGSLGRIDGVVLVTLYVIYNVSTLWGERVYMHRRRRSLVRRIWRRMGDLQTDKDIGWLAVGVATMLLAAEIVVGAMTRVTSVLGVSVFLGGILLAIGTTLPELSFGIEALRRKEVGMVYGNLLGSVAANATLIVGLVSIISPFRLVNGLKPYLVATMAFVVVFGLFWWFTKTKKKLERWEGAVLMIVYVVFLTLEFWRVE